MGIIGSENIRDFLDEKYEEYCNVSFIESDPICVPHSFTDKEDIEIAGFLVATLAWGARPQIIKKAFDLLKRMDNSPSEFIKGAGEGDLVRLVGFKYRTFNDSDLLFFIHALQYIYKYCGGLEKLFTEGFAKTDSIYSALVHFREYFLFTEHLDRSEKHVANVLKGSAAKRINMYLRWMVRSNKEGVDFGLWKSIPSNKLMMPLDLHSRNVADRLGLLLRKQNDWKAVEELTSNLLDYDSNDPVKYDYALFGLGVFEKMWM